MLDAVSYQRNIGEARAALTNYRFGQVGSRGPVTTRTKGYGVWKVIDDEVPVTLIFQLHDLYLEGWRNKNLKVFLHSRSGYDQAAKKFYYGNDYGELGYHRTQAITLDLRQVNGALAQAYNASDGTDDNAFKRSFVVLAIAFSEAIRFSDVMLKIIKGLPIDDLDWKKHRDESAVMVEKAKS